MPARLLFLLAIVALAPGVAGDDVTVKEAIVPVVGSIEGLGGVVWSTDIALHNPMAYDVEVAVTLVGAPEDPFYFTTIAAGDTITFPDMPRRTFGIVGRLCPMKVQTLSSSSVTVAAVVHGMTAEGPTEPQVLTVQYDRMHPMLQTLPALHVGKQFRTNIGVVNPSDREAVVLLALQRVEGRSLGVITQTLPPRTHVQLPLQSFFPLLTEGENLSLVVEHTNPEAYVYASVIANASHNARYYGPH